MDRCAEGEGEAERGRRSFVPDAACGRVTEETQTTPHETVEW